MSAPSESIEGRLNIALRPRSEGYRVTITSSRPVLAARLFEGKSIGEALRTIPILFNVCGQAQAVAAIRAIEAALALSASNSVNDGRAILLALETLREHLFRVGIDWPQFAAADSNLLAFTPLLKHVRDLQCLVDPNGRLVTRPGQAVDALDAFHFAAGLDQLRKALVSYLFACELEDWLAMDVDQLRTWIDTTSTPATALLKLVLERNWEALGAVASVDLPPLPPAALCRHLDGPAADAFIQWPDWLGESRETGPVVRHANHPLIVALSDLYGRGLLTRLIARLIEIAKLALDPRGTLQCDLPQQPGLCQLEAARGRLCHRVELAGDRLKRLRILAPTEWNFHPRGVAADALSTLRGEDPDSTILQAKLLIHAIDPCVGYKLMWEM